MRRVRPDPCPTTCTRILDGHPRPSGGNTGLALPAGRRSRGEGGDRPPLPRQHRPALEDRLRRAHRRRRGRSRRSRERAAGQGAPLGPAPGRPLRAGAAVPVRVRAARPHRRLDLPGGVERHAGRPRRRSRLVAHQRAGLPPRRGARHPGRAPRRGLDHGVLRSFGYPTGRWGVAPRHPARGLVPQPLGRASASRCPSRCGRRRRPGATARLRPARPGRNRLPARGRHRRLARCRRP